MKKKNNIKKGNVVTLIEIFNLQLNKKIRLGCTRTASNYKTCIRKLTLFLKEDASTFTLRQVTPEWVESWVKHLTTLHPNHPETVDFYFRISRAMYNLALESMKDKQGYVAYQKTSAPMGNTGEGSFPLPIPEALTPGNTYNTLIVANYDRFKADGKTFADYIAENRSKDYGQMRRDMKSRAINRARVTTPLPLYGTLLGKDGEESLFTAPQPEATGKLPVSVRFSRAVSRFDLHNMAADRLVIAWVKVCNYRDAGYFFHQDVPLGDAVVKGTAATPPSDPNNLPAGYVKADPPVSGTNRQDMADGGLYAYPNTASYTTQDDERTTCLLIAGYYQNEAGGEINATKLTYYRANVADNGLSQVLKRNYAYTVVINSVKREGADTEDQAMSEKDRLLDYAVDDAWEEDNNNTVVDDKGNFLTVSRTSVVLNASANESAVIKVSVKEGLGWKLAWRENVGDNFKCEKIDDSSFRIVATHENSTVFVNTAQLEVEATGITPTPAKPLKVTINITQLSTTGELEMLSVEGQTGTVEMSVPGQGTTFSLQVLTGGATGSWMTSADNYLSGFIGSDYTKFGGNKGRIHIQFQPNVSNAPRSGTLTVTRSPAGSVPDVKIHFTQEPSKYLVTVFPNYGNDPLVVNGFSNDIGNPDGVVKVVPFSVKLVDPEKYTFKVESGFREDVDAFLALTSPQNENPPRQATYTGSSAGTTLTGELDGQMFYLGIFRTGPGDMPITQSIKVTAVDRQTGLEVTERQFTFTVTIETNCRIDDVDLRNLDITVADRNCGAQLKQTSTALNYANQENHPDHANTLFRGEYFTFDKDKLASRCAEYGDYNYEGPTMKQGWRPPTKTEQEAMIKLVKFSKQRAFIASGDAVDGYVGCWLPTSGEGDPPTKTSGFFWSGTPATTGNGYYMAVHASTRGAGTGSNYGSKKFSLRCVRPITVPPAR